jgi:Spy/CpxP family protein refolding chaperone
MLIRKRILLVALWTLSLVTFVMFAAHAQAPTPGATDARIRSGSDIGFRVERQGRNGVEGTLMVRVDGKWVPAEPVERLKY